MKAKVIFLLILGSFFYLNSTAQYFSSYADRNIEKQNTTLFSSFDVVFQRLKLKLDPNVYFLQGAVDVYYRAKDALDTLLLDLSDSLQVDSVKQGGDLLFYAHKYLL